MQFKVLAFVVLSVVLCPINMIKKNLEVITVCYMPDYGFSSVTNYYNFAHKLATQIAVLYGCFHFCVN